MGLRDEKCYFNLFANMHLQQIEYLKQSLLKDLIILIGVLTDSSSRLLIIKLFLFFVAYYNSGIISIFN